MAPQPLFLTLRPTLKVSTCSFQVTPTSRFLATIDSTTSILFRSNDATALAGCYLVDMVHAAGNCSAEEHIMEN